MTESETLRNEQGFDPDAIARCPCSHSDAGSADSTEVDARELDDRFRPKQEDKLWAHLDSNQGPTGYEPVALSAELWAPREGQSPSSDPHQSGWRESNPQQQLGRLRQYHFATPANPRPVGAAGLEPATSASQTQRATRLRHAPPTI